MHPRSGQPPAVSDPEEGVYRGVAVARRFVSPDGMTVLVGKTDQDNEALTFGLAAPHDFWLHVAGVSGSHVVVRNPEKLLRLPRATSRFAAALAARYSKARHGGTTAVHLCRCRDVAKPRGYAAGKVSLSRFTTIHASPLKHEDDPTP